MSWSLAHRIGFRFWFAYVALYTTGLIRPGLVTWAGAHVFGKTITAPAHMGGSGDTTFHWVQAFCVLASAIAAAAVWSVADRARPHYRSLHRWLHAWLRYSLGTALIGYGFAKIVKTQFPFPSMDRLTEQFGEASPMGLLWTFMGFSAGYNVFAGLAEAIPGLLLFFRPTALLGALLGAAAMANVVALNFFYDVPVKILSTHLLLFALSIAAPDLSRLARVFLFNQAAPPADLTPAIGSARIVRVWQYAKAVLLVAMIGSTSWRGWSEYRKMDGAVKPEIYGVYRVEQFSMGDDDEATGRWAEVAFGRIYEGNGMARVRFADGEMRRFGYSFDAASITMQNQEGGYRFESRKPERDVIELAGTMRGEPVKMRLRKRASAMLLETRGFHWVNEFPFNR